MLRKRLFKIYIPLAKLRKRKQKIIKFRNEGGRDITTTLTKVKRILYP